MKKLVTLIFVFISLSIFSQNGNYNGWGQRGNPLGAQTYSLGSIDNFSFVVVTNSTRRMAFGSDVANTPSVIALGTFSVASSMTVNGVFNTNSAAVIGGNILATSMVRVGSATNPVSTLDVSGSLGVSSISTFSGNSQFNAHIIGGSIAPSSALGTGAGIGATATLTNCTDIAGTVSITTAGTPSGSNADVITLTFAVAYGTAPHIALTPRGVNSAGLSGTTQVFPVTATGSLIIKSGTVGLTTGTIYSWDYVLIQ